MTLTLVCGVIILVGLVGVLVPVVPGLLLTVGATLLWAYEHPAPQAWIVFGISVALYLAGVVLQYLLPGKRMRQQGIGGVTMLAAVVLAIVGFFVVPVVGFALGFVLGIFLVELSRRRGDRYAAWAATKTALQAVLHSMGIELAAGAAILLTWLIGVATLGIPA